MPPDRMDIDILIGDSTVGSRTPRKKKLDQRRTFKISTWEKEKIDLK